MRSGFSRAGLMLGVAASFLLGVGGAARADSWAIGTPIPAAVTWASAAALKNQIYVVGGIDNTNTILSTVRIYDPVAGTWSMGPALPAPVFGAAVAVVGNVLYVMGGYINMSDNESATVYALNLKTQTWSTMAPMLTAQGSAKPSVASTTIYVVGGNTNGQLRISTVESYDTLTNTWTRQPSMMVGKSELSGGIVGSTIIAADGFSGGGVTGDNESFTIGKSQWKSLAGDPIARNGACSGVIGKVLYAADGDDNSNGAINVMESYDLKLDEWKSLVDMPNIVTNAGSAVYKGKLYCFGGANYAPPFAGPVTPYDYVQVYTP